jgi:hypothetical protein
MTMRGNKNDDQDQTMHACAHAKTMPLMSIRSDNDGKWRYSLFFFSNTGTNVFHPDLAESLQITSCTCTRMHKTCRDPRVESDPKSAV